MAFNLNISNPVDRIAAEEAVFGRKLEDVEYLELEGNLMEFCDINVAFNEPWSKAQDKGSNNGKSSIRILILQCLHPPKRDWDGSSLAGGQSSRCFGIQCD